MSDDKSEFLGLEKKEKTTMKYLAALLVMVMFLGCGKTEEITTEDTSTKEIATKEITTGDIIGQVNSTGIITDEQAESLSKVEMLELNGLTSITDEQAESLSKVETLLISKDLQPLINKYKNQ